MSATLLSLWADQVARRASACAISTTDHGSTYSELAARVAGYENHLCAGKPTPVGLLCSEPLELIAAMLACIATGRVFAPFDVRTPVDQLRGALSALTPGTVITDQPAASTLTEGARDLVTSVVMATDIPDASWSPSRWARPAAPDAGYVYFTSGTTGRPKGIRGSMRAVQHFVSWEIAEFAVVPGTRVSQLTSPGFDAFLRDAFVPLCSGGTICVPPAETTLVGERLAEWLAAARVELVHCVPTVFRTLYATQADAGTLPCLRTVLLAGEAMRGADVAWWRARFGDRELVNLYGPSETTMTKLFHRTDADDAGRRLVPVGRPMPGVAARVLHGAAGQDGEIGEIEIEVPFPLLGYLDGQPGGFVAGGRRFRTGDFGRLRPDGALELLGRRDRMVKVNGIRVEPGEIEGVLLLHPDVHDAFVAAVETDNRTTLSAYLVAGQVADNDLIGHARRHLPAVMVPTAIVRVSEIPRMLNGKVDARRLPRPGATTLRPDSGNAPSGELETDIAAMWAELLGHRAIGRHEDFMQLGGDSLAMARLLDWLRSRYRAELPLRTFLSDPTVAGVAAAVSAMTGVECHGA
jgi:amino acid adenylation domain-containing protein